MRVSSYDSVLCTLSEGSVLTLCIISPQLFDSNLNKDKLLRMKLGAGKVIKVRDRFYC